VLKIWLLSLLFLPIFGFASAAKAEPSKLQCIDLFVKTSAPQFLDHPSIPEVWRVLYEQRQLQELVWAAQNAGHPQVASLVRDILQTLLERDSVVSMENSLGGSTEVYLVKFSSGIQGVFKPRVEDWKIKPSSDGGPANYRAEIAASKLDDLLDIRAVPLTIERQIGDQRGSLQVFLSDSPSLHVHWGRIFEFRRLNEIVILDILTGNIDRGAKNMLIWNDQLVAIDNGMGFGWMKAHSTFENAFYTRTAVAYDRVLNIENLVFLKKVQEKITLASLKSLLGDSIPVEILEQMIGRKNKLMADFEKRFPGALAPHPVATGAQ
jgi:hypothetical protein